MHPLKTLGASVALAATLMFAGVARDAAAQTPTATDRDATIKALVHDKLAVDPTLKPFDIDVSVSGGVATLTGTVQTDAQRARAARLARVKGVTKVDNEVVVDKTAGGDLASQLKATGRTAGETAKAASAVAAEKTKDALSKTGEVMTDAWIVTKVHARFAGDTALKGSDMKVSSKNHVVTLSGTVSSAAARDRAIDLAKTTEGVLDVDDQLTIR
jgi:osmotically-inducible protein OsmY